MRINIGQEMNCLGLLLRYNMSWTSHVNRVIDRCSVITASLRCLRERGIARDCLMIVYQQLFMAYLSYMAPVWAECGIINLNRLQVSQNQALRAIYDLPMDSSVRVIFTDLKIMTVRQHLDYFTHLYAFRNFRTMMDPNIIYQYRPVYMRTHRNNLLYVPPKLKLILTRRDLNYRLCIIWNNLNNRFRNLLGIRGFKKLIREGILSENGLTYP
jgi:hypothetical protein